MISLLYKNLLLKYVFFLIYLIKVLINIIINSTDTEYTVAEALPGTSFSGTASDGWEEEIYEYYLLYLEPFDYRNTNLCDHQIDFINIIYIFSYSVKKWRVKKRTLKV